MTETNTQGDLGDVVNEQLPRIIKIRPGSSSEREIMTDLPAELRTATVAQVLDYVRHDPGLKRKDDRIVGRIQQEMSGAYGVTIGGNPVEKTADMSQYFQRAVSPKGVAYEIAEVIVAANESGGARYLRAA